ncbi:hypothetical protein [Blastococcus sp. CT_GayMR16]|uniref:hypothetical protein n=1 Tax=Blastococcus sp. CT_GayMR16 TaxID=2559607 RepID=UPI0010743D6E|nr:hypothetical protein [Blastococcus sp. CT_GayMR16]TFV83132.1 hypothetical protein E4P38_20980 [Blastococcus sp. CT_GayMR16]
MAGHYMDQAAHLVDMQAAKKLVLMCIADDADKLSRIGRVGLDAIMDWSGLKRSRALAVIAELVDEGYLVRHAAGRIGRQAEFVVFPGGCCPLHGPVPGYTPPTDNADEEQTEDLDTAGSDTADPLPDTAGSGQTDPRSDVEGPIEGPEEGPVQGPAATGPLPKRLNPQNTPQPPAERGAHCDPDGQPHPNCRGCGTTRRTGRVTPADTAAAELAAVEDLRTRRAAIAHCGACSPYDRTVEVPGLGIRRCPDCHPDLVVGPMPRPQLSVVPQRASAR